MEEKFTWKAEIEFEGTAEEFNRLAASLEELPIEISIREWLCRPHHFAGCMPIPVEVLLGEDRLSELAEGMPRIQIKYIRDIYGGMRTPHFHWKDDIVLLDRARFRAFVGQVARELAERRAERVGDYVEVMQPVDDLGSALPSPIP